MRHDTSSEDVGRRRARGPPIAAVVRICAAVLAVLFLGAAAAAPEAIPKRVLVLNAGDSTLPAAIAMSKGLAATFAESDRYRIELHAEYLDAFRFPTGAADRISGTVAEKYGGALRPQLVVAIGKEALDFAVARRDLIGLTTPIVFAVGGLDQSPLPPAPPNTAGLVARLYLAGTLDLASRLQPSARHLVLVAGVAPRDQSLLQAARMTLQQYPGRFEVTELVGLPVERLVTDVEALPADTIILYLTVVQDSAGTTLASPDVAGIVANAAAAPVYTVYDTALGRGPLGGRMDQFEPLGSQLAAIGLRLLGGEDPAAIGTRETTSAATLIDWQALRRLGLDAGRLPADAEILFRQPSIWERYSSQIIAVGAIIAGLTVSLLILLAERRRRMSIERSLRALTGSVLTAQDDERRRIARELHDTTGQNIAVASLIVGKLRHAPQADRQSGLGELDDVLRRSMQEIRTLSYVLHPPLLDEAGLKLALPHYVEEFSRRSDIAVRLDIDPALERLPMDVELALFRVVQESLTNVSRHSGCKSARIGLRMSGETSPPQVLLTIEDRGVGFQQPARGTPGGWRTPQKPHFIGLGLTGMEERVHRIGGCLKIDSAAGRTVVSASFPGERPGSARATSAPAELEPQVTRG